MQPRPLIYLLTGILAILAGWFAASLNLAHGQENAFTQIDYRWVNGSRDAGAARVMADSNVATLAGLQIIDSVQTTTGDTILLTAQTDATKNGLWTAAAGNWTRPLHFSSFANRPPGTMVYIAQGTVNAGKWFTMTNTSRPTIGTDTLTFSEFVSSGSGDLSAADIDTLAELNALLTDGDFLSTAAASAAYQPLDADLTDLADGTLSASAIDSAITRDTEWDTFAEINAASTDTDAVLDTDIGVTVQAYDADLADLADGTLSAAAIDPAITRDTEWDTFAEINAASTDTDAVLDTDIGVTVASIAQGNLADSALQNGDHWTTAGSNIYRLNGDVGFSQSTPSAKIDINSPTFADLMLRMSRSDISRGLRIKNHDGTYGTFILEASQNLSAWSPAISIATDYTTIGSIGIGTSRPYHLLDVAGTFRAAGTATFNGEVNAAGQVKSNGQNVLDITDIGAAIDAFADQVSGAEITTATETTVRNYAPADIKAFIDQHAGGGGDLSEADIDTLAELNAILTDATLVSGAGSDDLGDHTATQDLDLNGNDIIGLGTPANDDALSQVLVRATDGTIKYRTAASIAGAGGATSGLLDFEAQGGVEGIGASESERQDNWALLKTLEGQQDTNSLPIYFPAGDWYFLPTIDATDDPNNPWGTDHIEADAGTTILRGAGKTASRLHFPNRNYWYLFRQRAWDASLVIEDLALTTDGVHSQTFTADASTDKLTASSHGLLSVFQYLKFQSTGTLPDPLAFDTQSSVERVAVVLADANSFFVKNWLTGATSFTLDAGADTLSAVGHNFSAGDLFVPQTTGSLSGTGIAAATRYFVVNAGTDDFQLEATLGGGAIDITATGSGTHSGYPVYDITDAGTGTHTFYEIGDRAYFLAGFSTGASSGIDSSDGSNEFNIYYRNVEFEGAPPFTGVSSLGAKNLTMLQCDVFDCPSVAVNLYVNDTGTEGTDWKRPNLLLDGCRFEMRAGSVPFGNHFLYSHPQPNCRVTNSVFIGCRNNAVQFQGESAVAGAGAQIVTNSYFKDNLRHFIGAQAQDDRSRALIANNTFDGTGGIEFRSDALFANNFVRGFSSPTISLTDTITDDTLRKETYLISNNTFIVAGVNHPNAWASFIRDGEHIIKFSGNIWRRDPSFLGQDDTFFLGSIGSVTSGDSLAEVYFENETYSFDTDGSALGWFLYPAKFYEFRDCTFDGPEAIALTDLNSSGGTDIRVLDSRFEYEDGASDAQKAAISIGHTGWTLTGRGNHFADKSYLVNGANTTGTMEFAGQRNPTSITAAATVYVDPSYDTHVVTGTTTINTITIGVTGNVAADAAATNHTKLWTGEINLIVPSGLTISAAGNIANGPYTSASADAISLLYQPATQTWLIKN